MTTVIWGTLALGVMLIAMWAFAVFILNSDDDEDDL